MHGAWGKKAAPTAAACSLAELSTQRVYSEAGAAGPFFSGSRSGSTSPVFLSKRTFLPSTSLQGGQFKQSTARQGE